MSPSLELPLRPIGPWLYLDIQPCMIAEVSMHSLLNAVHAFPLHLARKLSPMHAPWILLNLPMLLKPKDNLGALLLHPACNMTSSHAWPPNHMLPLHCDHHHDAHVIFNVSFVPYQNHLTYLNVCILQKP